MAIRVLGPLQVDGVDLPPRDRTALAALVAASGPLPVDSLADALWGDRPPPSASKVVQGCVVRLRRVLGAAAVATTSAGYRLTVPEQEVDARRFERLATRARSLSSEPDRAVALCAEALRLWRGPALPEVRGWPTGRTEAGRLEELRRQVQELQLEARLALGEAGTADAQALVADDPLREHRWALLARSLYRSGRQADALAALRRVRVVLRDELGVDPGPELVAVEKAVLRQDPGLVAVGLPRPRAETTCPYKGLASYEAEDADRFFGREEEVLECLRVLRSCGVLVVVGPSGSGKSSLVRAGLAPALATTGTPAGVVTPGPDPATRLTLALASRPRGSGLVVDQLEELFVAGTPPEVARDLLDRLAEAVTAGTPVVVAVRSDRLEGVAQSPSFARLAEVGVHLLTPLTGDRLRTAIQRPADLAGLRLEPGLVDLMLQEAGEVVGALPLLSHALAETWARREGAVLTLEGYRRAGGLSGAVAQSAERLFESLSEDRRRVLRALVLRLVTEAPDGSPVLTQVPWEQLGRRPDRLEVVELLARARLLTTDDTGVAVAHEAVLRAWPRLRSWLDEDAAGRRRLRHLSVAAEDWRSAGRPDSELYRGGRLEDVLAWRSADQPDLTEPEDEFLAASVDRAEAEREDAARQLRTEARRSRRLRLALTGTAAGLVLAVSAGGVAWRQSRDADALAASSQVDRLVAESASLLGTRRDLAALLAAEAYRARPDAASRSALFRVLTDAPGFSGYTAMTESGPLSAAHLLPDGRTLLGVDRAGAVHAVDLVSGSTSALPAPDADVDGSDLAVSADGRTAVVASWQGTDDRGGVGVLSVVDVPTRTRRADLGLRLDAGAVAVDAEGRFVAVSGDTAGRVLLVDTAVVPRLAPQLRIGGQRQVPGVRSVVPGSHAAETGPDAGVRHTAAVAFRPDGALLVGSRHGSLYALDPATGRVLEELAGAPALTSTTDLAWSPDGSVLVSTGPAGVVRWDTASRSPSWWVRGPEGGCTAVVVNASEVLCGDRAGDVVALDAATGLATGARYDLQRGPVSGLAVTPDGTELLETSGAEAVLARWRLGGPGPVARPLSVDAVPLGYDSAGRLLLVRAPEGDLAVLDAATGDLLSDLEGWERAVWTARPHTLAAWDAQGTGFVVDVHRQEPVRQLNGHLGVAPEGAAVAAGTDVLVAWGATSAEAVAFWDLGTGQPTGRSLRRGGEHGSLVADGSLLTSRLGSATVVHEVSSGARLASRDDVVSAAASPTGLVAGSTASGDLHFYDARTLTESGPPVPGTPGHVEQFAFSVDGALLAVRTGAGEAWLVDVEARVGVGEPLRLAPGADGIALRPDGLALAVPAVHGLTVWDLRPQRWAEAACALAGRTLSDAERATYLPAGGVAACD